MPTTALCKKAVKQRRDFSVEKITAERKRSAAADNLFGDFKQKRADDARSSALF